MIAPTVHLESCQKPFRTPPAHLNNFKFARIDPHANIHATSRCELAYNLFLNPNSTQGEIMIITKDYNIYHMPCGDLCATSCLPEAEEVPTTEV